MSSQDMLIAITPEQAAHGAIVSVELPSGPVRVRIPPCRHGDLVKVRVGTEEVRLRIHVSGAGVAWIAGAGGIIPPPAGDPAPQRPAPVPQTGGGRGCLVGLAVAALLVIGFFLLRDGDGGDDAKPAGDATPTWSSSRSPSPTPSPRTSDPETTETTPYDSGPSVEPSEEPSPEPTPFDRGTCLNGQLPDSTTPRSVSGVEEVPCSASDAHYRVIESIPGTSDLDRCSGNPRTQYAFSYRYLRGSIVLNQYVYCLVGIGSYAR
ncbi:hypothetical protein AW27_019135 [Streptomyces sp. PCS3-D2]|uniref:LppU/SCO3897 family protein n=1 Tax=Streptomyces sp. PCS3-D2 TaxID=1460244 RepID=UPI0007C6F6AD|nr:hypothetical protein [Streptomyces sp. PCS3-D2]WKV73451.1 hypothetical protein AW27_019135 [Streptomyces sp. PCS3-D2]